MNPYITFNYLGEELMIRLGFASIFVIGFVFYVTFYIYGRKNTKISSLTDKFKNWLAFSAIYLSTILVYLFADSIRGSEFENASIMYIISQTIISIEIIAVFIMTFFLF